MIEDFWVAVELAIVESSATHNRAGSTKAGAHDSAAPRCVRTYKAIRARQTRPGMCDKPGKARTTGLGHT